MAAQVAELDQVFVLRFWQEKTSESQHAPRWRVRIREVNTGRQFYADGIDAAFLIVRSLLFSDRDPSAAGS